MANNLKLFMKPLVIGALVIVLGIGVLLIVLGIGISVVWISIPAGTYQQGCVPQHTNCYPSEKPRHSVTVSAFEMMETEVTNAQYVEFMNSNGNICNSHKCVASGATHLGVSEFGGVFSVDSDYENYPITMVTWFGAKAFCKAVGGRLPSEAEWEYTARAGTTTIYYCGDDSSCLHDIAGHRSNSDGHFHPVGEKTVNAFGLYDMIGNVQEWTEDCWHDNYNGHPGTSGVWTGGNCRFRVQRGGYGDEGYDLRGSYRQAYNPVMYTCGFRCARD